MEANSGVNIEQMAEGVLHKIFMHALVIGYRTCKHTSSIPYVWD